MQKSIRSFVLVAIVTFAAAPALHAGRMGTNPRPIAQQTTMQAILSFFGF